VSAHIAILAALTEGAAAEPGGSAESILRDLAQEYAADRVTLAGVLARVDRCLAFSPGYTEGERAALGRVAVALRAVST
jgi:hypothetical protein